MDIEQFPYAFAVNALGTENPNLETTNKTIVGGMNELKTNIDKLNIIKWKNVGNKISDTQINYNFINQKTYKITYTAGTIDNAKMYKKFIYTGKSTILETITWTRLHVSSDNKVYTESKTLLGYILLLEELQEENTYKINSKTLNITPPTLINMQKPIKIDSKTLLTNELEENNWEIEQKENPIPTPCPCPKWKEVGTVGKNNWDNWTIEYDFKDNGRYRVYYNWSEYDYIKIMTEFIHNLPVATNEIVSFEDGNNHMVLTMGWAKNLTIYSLKGKGKLWKLEELQE